MVAEVHSVSYKSDINDHSVAAGKSVQATVCNLE